MDVHSADGEVVDFDEDHEIPDGASQVTFYGELNDYPCASFVINGLMMIIAGCRVFPVAEGLRHWKDREDRREIYGLCVFLTELSSIRGLRTEAKAMQLSVPEHQWGQWKAAIENDGGLDELLEQMKLAEASSKTPAMQAVEMPAGWSLATEVPVIHESGTENVAVLENGKFKKLKY